MHSKVHIIFFLLNSGKNQSTCHFLPASQKKTVFSLQTPGSDRGLELYSKQNCVSHIWNRFHTECNLNLWRALENIDKIGKLLMLLQVPVLVHLKPISFEAFYC